MARGAWDIVKINPEGLSVSFQNSLIREVENAKKQLEEAQHDKVLSSLPREPAWPGLTGTTAATDV